MSKHTQAWLIVVLLLCTTCARSASKSLLTPVTIDLFNDAAVAGPVLKSAETEVERIFDAAHIQIRWRDCNAVGNEGSDPACRVLRASDHLSLRIVPGSARENGDIFGVAFLGADGSGSYCDVFYGAVEKIRSDSRSNVGRVLGHVMAHEIGHLLLGAHAHSAWGIMAPKWHDQELKSLDMGLLLFSAEQDKAIHSRLNRESTAVADFFTN